MKRRLVLMSMCLTMAVPMLACHREEKIEEIPVSEIKVSEPPEYQLPEKPVIRYGEDGIYKVAENKYFGAVVPMGAVELSKSDEEIHFYVSGMSMTDVEFFLNKYFPYQKSRRYTQVDMMEVYAALKDEYADGSVFPSLDAQVVRPTADSAVEIKVYWSTRDHQFEWIYRNPDLRKPSRVEFLEREDENPPEPEPFVMPSDEEIERMRAVIEPMAFEKQYAEMKRLAAESEARLAGAQKPAGAEDAGVPGEADVAMPEENGLPGGGLLMQNMKMGGLPENK